MVYDKRKVGAGFQNGSNNPNVKGLVFTTSDHTVKTIKPAAFSDFHLSVKQFHKFLPRPRNGISSGLRFHLFKKYILVTSQVVNKQ